MNSSATLEVCVPHMSHYACSLCRFWPVNCTKIGGHVELPSDPTVHSLYCVYTYDARASSVSNIHHRTLLNTPIYVMTYFPIETGCAKVE